MASVPEDKKDSRSPPELNIILPISEDIGETRVDWSEIITSKLPIDLLLITAIDCEFASCYYYLQNKTRSWCHGLGYVDFGEFGDENLKVKVALMKCSNQGINQVNSSLIVARNAATILRPKAVICVGVCGMINPKKAKLGDVVISTKLAMFSNVKSTADGIEWRGTKADVTKGIGKLILHADHGWKAPFKPDNNFERGVFKVHRDAAMLSGPELVNKYARREELFKKFPDAIATEMEGEGLYVAAYDLGIEWVVVKGISDRADGSKTETEKWQPFASTMAASVVHHMFKHPDVIKSWRNYKETVPGSAVTPGENNKSPPTSSTPLDQL